MRAFKTLANNILESFAKGDRVFVHGTVTTEAWTDTLTGDKRTAQRVLADIVGPSLRWATTRITRPPAPRPRQDTARPQRAGGPIKSGEAPIEVHPPGALSRQREPAQTNGAAA